MAENDGSLSNGRNLFEFYVKSRTVYELCFETCRHPPSIHLFRVCLNFENPRVLSLKAMNLIASGAIPTLDRKNVPTL